jgi:hypothetical protein
MENISLQKGCSGSTTFTGMKQVKAEDATDPLSLWIERLQ